MTRRVYTTPGGTRDELQGRSALLRRTEEKLLSCFEGRGYFEVRTPTLEFYDVFTADESALDHTKIYKLIDGGEILALRPDSTAPVGRLAATKLSSAPLPLRLSYCQTVLRCGGGNRGARTETRQCGVELVGADGLWADLELAEAALTALKESGLSGYKLELGHAGIFGALMRSIDLRDGDDEQIMRLTAAKNYSALNDLLSAYRDSNPGAVEAICRLPELFGGAEVFDGAESLIHEPEALAGISALKALYSELEKLGFGDDVLLDLGLVNGMDYYTGVVFGAYAEGTGEQVLSGGRYDSLYRNYGAGFSASGFAVNVDAVCDALEKLGGRAPAPASDVLVCFAPANAAEAFSFAKELRACGKRVEIAACSAAEGRRIASEKRIARSVFFGEEGTGKELLGE
ncbi:MAG: ATP phosphoribosyltransferase regulatory subunit [Clostridiales bacterium]|nr:ATP phosphoribosyltransferase regulatory subunit [Clostridiales bacterium]